MTAPLRVLIVEDDPSDAKLVAVELSRAGRAVEVERVEDADAMRAALANARWDLVISDWSMPRFSALAALEVLKSTGLDLPFIVVSGTIGEERAVAALHGGAHDFVLKDRLARLLPAVERELRERAERAARRSAQQALRAQEARFRSLIEKSEDGISLTGRDGEVIYLSPAAERILGCTSAERVGRSALELLHPDDREAVRANTAALGRQPGASATIEFRVLRPDGAACWVEGTATNLLDDPTVGAVIGNFRDVSERKRGVDALRASEERYRRIIETTNEGVWMLDADARTTFVNDQMARLLGLTADAMRGRTALELISPEAHAHFQQALHHLQGGAAQQLEVPFARADGTTVWALLEVSPYLDAGRFSGALVMAMDITARKLAEASLRVSESRFRGLWDSGLIMVTISDLAGRLREVNALGLRMLGYTRDELTAGGISWGELTPPEWREADERAKEQLAAVGVAPPWEKELVRKDGTRVPILAGAAMLQGAEVIAIALDLTERKRAEATLQHTGEQLRHAQKMEAVGRLAGGIAHDFNNVLSVILGFSDLALSDLSPGDALREDLEEIRSAGQRAADLTRQLLMFSRQQVIEPRVLDLNDMLAGTEKMLRRVVGEDIELVVVPAPSLGRVRVDPSSIEQVVMNLVVNARDAMPTGGRLVIATANVVLDEAYAGAHHGLRPGPYVRLTVTDTGAGMDEATQARIFEPFFTTKEKGKGTGLGLSTVFGIVQQGDGSIAVESEPGRGATFRVYLPRVDHDVDLRRLPIAPGLRHGHETVLLVEDEDQVRAVARSILRRHGYEVIECSNAGEALIYCERHSGVIHLLLTDVVMPQMSGPELARRLTQARPGMRVLCMSGYTDDSVIRHGVLAAELAFIQKPLTPETLTQRVREVLDAPLPAAPL
ncbi:MAG: PAS domain S-box protein [Deltaproteobacteria bacterium]|nr:PAS domain S-box protein [Deltaproteobacteria bacterium]